MRIRVRVTPNASKQRIIEADNLLKVYVSAPPDKGKANKRLIKILSKYFKVKKSDLNIVRGEKSRDKVLEVNKDEA